MLVSKLWTGILDSSLRWHPFVYNCCRRIFCSERPLAVNKCERKSQKTMYQFHQKQSWGTWLLFLRPSACLWFICLLCVVSHLDLHKPEWWLMGGFNKELKQLVNRIRQRFIKHWSSYILTQVTFELQKEQKKSTPCNNHLSATFMSSSSMTYYELQDPRLTVVIVGSWANPRLFWDVCQFWINVMLDKLKGTSVAVILMHVFPCKKGVYLKQ